MAEKISKSAKINQTVRAIGRFRTKRFQDETGKNQSKIEIIAEYIELQKIGRKKEKTNKKDFNYER